MQRGMTQEVIGSKEHEQMAAEREPETGPDFSRDCTVGKERVALCCRMDLGSFSQIFSFFFY